MELGLCVLLVQKRRRPRWIAPELVPDPVPLLRELVLRLILYLGRENLVAIPFGDAHILVFRDRLPQLADDVSGLDRVSGGQRPWTGVRHVLRHRGHLPVVARTHV